MTLDQQRIVRADSPLCSPEILGLYLPSYHTRAGALLKLPYLSELCIDFCLQRFNLIANYAAR
jgi:hypothetical protein